MYINRYPLKRVLSYVEIIILPLFRINLLENVVTFTLFSTFLCHRVHPLYISFSNLVFAKAMLWFFFIIIKVTVVLPILLQQVLNMVMGACLYLVLLTIYFVVYVLKTVIQL